MYALSINSFATNWLLLCFISPLCSGAEKSHWTSYEVNDPMRYQSHPIQFDKISGQERHHQSSIQNYENKKLYNDYPRSQHGESGKFLEEKSDIRDSQLDQRDKETRLKEEEIMKKINILNKVLSEDPNENDVESKNTIEDRIIVESTMSEEAKRVVRQVRKQRPGFFWTLARLAFETFNDTRSAIQQINDVIGENFEPDTTTRRPSRINSSLVKPVTPSKDQDDMSSNLADVNVTATDTTTTERTTTTTTTTPTTTTPPTTTPTTTTTQQPYKFTVNGVQSLIRRNLRGLVRLFNIEWQDALNQSEVTVREFQQNLGNQIGSFLQDNPDAF